MVLPAADMISLFLSLLCSSDLEGGIDVYFYMLCFDIAAMVCVTTPAYCGLGANG